MLVLDKIKKTNPEFYQAYMDAPAAARHHSNHPGGLFKHSTLFTTNLKQWKRAHQGSELTEQDCEVIGMLHDVCKVKIYIPHEIKNTVTSAVQGITYSYDTDLVKRHALLSIEIVEGELGIQLSRLQRVCILLHMNGWENQEDWDALTQEDFDWMYTKEHQEILMAVNWADMAATKQEALDDLQQNKTNCIVRFKNKQKSSKIVP